MTSSIWGKKNFVYGCSTKLDRGGRLAQCGNLMIYLSIRFHAKSIMVNLVPKTAILTTKYNYSCENVFECGTMCVCLGWRLVNRKNFVSEWLIMYETLDQIMYDCRNHVKSPSITYILIIKAFSSKSLGEISWNAFVVPNENWWRL